MGTLKEIYKGYLVNVLCGINSAFWLTYELLNRGRLVIIFLHGFLIGLHIAMPIGFRRLRYGRNGEFNPLILKRDSMLSQARFEAADARLQASLNQLKSRLQASQQGNQP